MNNEKEKEIELENQKEEIQKILSDENLQVGNYDPRDRVNETLKVFLICVHGRQ